MSRSYRHNDFAFIGLILFVFVAVHLAYVISNSAREQDQTYAEKQCTEQQLRHAQSRAKTNVEGVQPPSADQRTDQTNNEQKGEPDWCDLAAQQAMANSTRRTEWSAWASTILTLIGVILITFTLYFTAGTLDEAKVTAKAAIISGEAAQKAAKVAEDALKLGERAYLFPAIHGIQQGAHKQTLVILHLTNVGKTPAFWDCLYAGFREEEPTSPPTIENMERYGADCVIAANDENRVNENFTKSGNDDCYFVGRIDYKDIFGEPHKTWFCMRIRPKARTFINAGPTDWNKWD